MKTRKILLPLALAFTATATAGIITATSVTAKASDEFKIVDGAYIRVSENHEGNKYGIKFEANVGTPVAGVSYNVMVIPSEYVTAYEAIQGEKKELAAFMLDAKAANEDMPLAVATGLVPDENGNISVSIIDILWNNLSNQFIAAAYYEKDGEIVCSALAEDGKRSIVDVASNAIQSGNFTENETVTDALEGFIYNAIQQKLGVSFEEKDQAGKEAAISFAETAKDAMVGDTFTLSYTPYLATSLVAWSSNNTAVATVENGTVNVVGVGQATITADLLGLKATCTVNAAAFVVPEGAITYTGGNTLDLGRTGEDFVSTLNVKDTTVVNGDYELKFSSDNTSVATVDAATGVVTAVDGGTANIYATVKGTKVPLTTVTVRNWTAISTAEEFMALNAVTSGYYYLTADLDMKGYTWTGVATFTGIIDGDYHAVSNLSRLPGNWSGNAPGTAAFITELTNGSEFKNIAFVDYMIFSTILYEGETLPMGMAVNSGFIQTNNGTMENVLIMFTRNRNYSAAWEQQGFGNGNGTVLAFTNNGTIKNCVAYNVSGGMTYALVGRNTGSVDNIYGFFEMEDDNPTTPNVVNQWSDWRGTYNLSVVWKAPAESTDHYYGFHDISQIFGCDNIENPQATNSALISGFNDATLANADFNDEFKALVNGYYNTVSVAKTDLLVQVDDTLDIAGELETALIAQADVEVTYAVADGSIATITDGVLTGLKAGDTKLNVQVVYNGVVHKTIAIDLKVTALSAIYTGSNELHVNRPTEQGGILELDLANSFTLSDGSALSGHTITYESSNTNAVVISEAGIATIANGATSGSATLYVIVDGVKLPLTTVNVISWTAISTASELAAIGPTITEAMGWRHDQNGNFYLTADLDMTGYVWGGWTTFTGIFDGNNHVVSNLRKNGVTWPEGLPGACAFVNTINAGSIIRNIGFVNYTFGACGNQGGFVQTNNGTIENVMFMGTRDKTATPAWLSEMGLVCGSAFAWKNNGTIKNCVVYAYTWSEEMYAIIAADNQGVIDSCYGFIYSEYATVDDTSNDMINTWTGWRGTYNIGITWTQPNGGDFGSITTTIGVASSNAATNSAALTGFDDATLTTALANFDTGFATMVQTYYK